MGEHPRLSVGVQAVARTGQAGGLKGCPVCVSLVQPLLPGARGQWWHCYVATLPSGVWCQLLQRGAGLFSVLISGKASGAG